MVKSEFQFNNMLIYIPLLIVYPLLDIYFYWSQFGLNPFEFLEFTDTVGLALGNLIFGGALILVVAPMIVALSSTNSWRLSIGFIVMLINFYFITGVTFDYLAFGRLSFGGTEALLVIPLAIANIYYIDNGLRDKITISNIRKYRIIHIIILLFLPLVGSISYGARKAQRIIENKTYYYTIDEKVCDNDTLKYLGHMGNTYILTSSTNQDIVLINDSQKLEMSVFTDSTYVNFIHKLLDL